MRSKLSSLIHSTEQELQQYGDATMTAAKVQGVRHVVTEMERRRDSHYRCKRMLIIIVPSAIVGTAGSPAIDKFCFRFCLCYRRHICHHIY
jgi:hypothetical protein